MGHTLKLDIYYFELKEIISTRETLVRGGEKRRYHKTKDEILNFYDVFSRMYVGEKRDKFLELFLKDFISSFNNAFVSNQSNTQAISVTDNLYKSVSIRNNVISGEFIGGQTGIDVDIYKTNNAIAKKDTLDRDSVASLSYYYKIWIPYDSNTGIVMVQSYTKSACTTLFKEKLESWFEEKNYQLCLYKFIPKQYIEKYKRNGYIYKIQIFTKRRNTDMLEPNYSPFAKAKSRVLIDNLKIYFNELFSFGEDFVSKITSDIKQIYGGNNEIYDEPILYYKDENGRKAHSKLSNIESMLPTIILDDDLKDTKTQKPLFVELDKFTNRILERIKEEIGYTPIENENI